MGPRLSHAQCVFIYDLISFSNSSLIAVNSSTGALVFILFHLIVELVVSCCWTDFDLNVELILSFFAA